MNREKIIENLIIERACMENQQNPLVCDKNCSHCGFNIPANDFIHTLEAAIDELHKVKIYRKKAKRWKRKYLDVFYPHCTEARIKIVGDKYEISFSDGIRKTVDHIIDAR